MLVIVVDIELELDLVIVGCVEVELCYNTGENGQVKSKGTISNVRDGQTHVEAIPIMGNISVRT